MLASSRGDFSGQAQGAKPKSTWRSINEEMAVEGATQPFNVLAGEITVGQRARL
ncbi:MAG: hypothetical protein AAF488_02785 [Planctomycetota bacterium]